MSQKKSSQSARIGRFADNKISYYYSVWRTTGWNARVQVHIFLRWAVRSAQTRFEIYNNAAQQTSSNKSRVYYMNTRNSWSLRYLCVCTRARACVCVCFIYTRVFPLRELLKKSIRPVLCRTNATHTMELTTGEIARDDVPPCINGGHCGLNNFQLTTIDVRRINRK